MEFLRASIFLLNATIKNDIEQHRVNDPEFVEQFLQAIYVDDFNDAAFLFYKKSKFFSNSPSLMARIQDNETLQTAMHDGLQANCLTPDESNREDATAPSKSSKMEHDESYTKSTTGNIFEPTTKWREQKILGIKWNYAEDKFVFDLEPIAQAAKNCEPTKRNIINVASRLYDPLSFISLIIIQMKLLFQSLCDNRIDCGTPLKAELRRKWLKLIDDLKTTKPLILPRCYFGCVEKKVVSRQPHGICDASMSVYAAVIYEIHNHDIRMIYETYNPITLVVTSTARRYAAFVTAKTRVAPIHKQTILDKVVLQ